MHVLKIERGAFEVLLGCSALYAISCYRSKSPISRVHTNVDFVCM